MTRAEAIEHGKEQLEIFGGEHREFIKMAIKALEQEPRKDEVILTNKEYRELVSNEYENGYAKGYREALEQESCIQEKQANADNIDAVYIDGFKAGYSQARFDLEQEPCDKCEVGNPCLYCKHEFESQESEEV